jgi:hypothetical protein
MVENPIHSVSQEIGPHTGEVPEGDSPEELLEQARLLSIEKRKDYRNVVFVQVAMMVIALVAEDLVSALGWKHSESLMWLVFEAMSAIYLYLMWDLLKNFTRKKRYLRFGMVWVLTIFIGSWLNNNVFYSPASGPKINAIFHFAVSLLEGVNIALATRDLLSGPRNTVDKLWASAAIYFLFGFAFSNIFSCIHLVQPDAFGPLTDGKLVGYFEGLYLSFTALSGCDNAYGNLSHLVRNLSLLEATIGQLYLVLLIGRVLLPEEPAETNEQVNPAQVVK